MDVLQLMNITINNENSSKEQGLAFIDNGGFIMKKEEASVIIEKLRKFYESDVDDFIKEENRKNSLINSPYLSTKLVNGENGKFEMPKPSIICKAFRDDSKRHWSFTCCWCGQKVSSKTHKQYFTLAEISNYQYHERACSKECCELAGKEQMKRWIIDNGYEDLFNLTNKKLGKVDKL